MGQRLRGFGMEEQKRRLKNDAEKVLQQTRRNREIYGNGLRLRLETLNVSAAVKQGAREKLNAMSSMIADKSYAWCATINNDDPSHCRKSDFWRSLDKILVDEGCESLTIVGRTGFRNMISIVHVDIMNIVYQPPLQLFQCKTISQCMLHTQISRFYGLVLCSSSRELSKIYFHCD